MNTSKKNLSVILLFIMSLVWLSASNILLAFLDIFLGGVLSMFVYAVSSLYIINYIHKKICLNFLGFSEEEYKGISSNGIDFLDQPSPTNKDNHSVAGEIYTLPSYSNTPGNIYYVHDRHDRRNIN